MRRFPLSGFDERERVVGTASEWDRAVLSKPLCPDGIRLFWRVNDVTAYNNYILQQSPNKYIASATDLITGAKSAEQETTCRQKLHTMSLIDTGSLPYIITFFKGKPYLITTNN